MIIGLITAALLAVPAPAERVTVHEIRSIETARFGIQHPSALEYDARRGVLQVGQRRRGRVASRAVSLTDRRSRRHLYIADRGRGSRPGRIVEVAVEAPRVTTAARQEVIAPYVQGIATSAWNPPAPDPAGITYVAADDKFIVSDSEVEEMTIYENVNVWETQRGSTSATGTGTTRGSPIVSNEPAGLGYDPATRTLWISDDDGERINAVLPGVDGRYGTADDTRTRLFTSEFGSFDPEGVEFDPATGHVFVCDGTGLEIYEVSPGANGSFGNDTNAKDGVVGDGDNVVTSFDIAAFGVRDCEGIGLHPGRATLLALDPARRKIFELTKAGRLVRIISLSTLPAAIRNTANVASVAVAPSSSTTDEPETMSLWVVDRQVDNGPDPNENDGLIHEFELPAAEPSPDAPVSFTATTATVSEAGPDLTLTLSRPDGGAAATVRLTTSAGTATGNEDYLPVDQVVAFASGATTATVDVGIVQDTFDEPDETLQASLSQATGDARIVTPDTISLAVLDDDPEPEVTVADASVIEGDTAADDTHLVFAVQLSTASARSVEFDAATEPGTAGMDDFEATGVTNAVIPAGATSSQFSVPVIEDTIDEPDEQLLLRLTDVANATLVDGVATGTILDDDEPTPTPTPTWVPTPAATPTPTATPVDRGAALQAAAKRVLRGTRRRVAGRGRLRLGNVLPTDYERTVSVCVSRAAVRASSCSRIAARVPIGTRRAARVRLPRPLLRKLQRRGTLEVRLTVVVRAAPSAGSAAAAVKLRARRT